jgi:hypothetical protein
LPEPAADDLLEREAELATVTELAERALAGHGGVVLVEGPAGIGKTCLTEAALARAAVAGLTVARARCAELERDFPFGVVRQLIEPLVAGLDSDDRDDVTAGAAALGASVLRDPEPHAGDTPYAALHGLYWLTANLAARSPIVLAEGRRDPRRAAVPGVVLPRRCPHSRGRQRLPDVLAGRHRRRRSTWRT